MALSATGHEQVSMHDGKPFVSVLMCVHNDRKFLQQSLDSLVSQTFLSFECVIVDDASTDGSAALLRRYAMQDTRFKIITNSENQGLGTSLNIGLNQAKGDYVARMDADDIALPQRFEKQVEFLEANPDITVLGCAATIIDDLGATIGKREYHQSHRDIVSHLWASPMLHPTVMMRRSALLDVGGYPPLRRKQDYALWFKAAKAGWKFANLPERLLLYRVTKSHFGKTGPAQAWIQLKVGFSGYARLGGLNPVIYLAMAYPLFRSFFPLGMQRNIAKIARYFDPRSQSGSS